MALRVVRAESTPVALPYGDALLLRLAREHRRLEALMVATVQQIERHERLLADGLAARNLDRFDIDGFEIRLHRGRVTVRRT